MYARTSQGILNRIRMERRLGIIEKRNKRKDSLDEIVRRLNDENISRTLSQRVQDKFLEMRNSSKKLGSVLEKRERSLENLTRGFIRESLVLKEELYRKKNIKGYKPKDYVFQLFGVLDPRSDETDNDIDKHEILFNHIEFSADEDKAKLRPLTEIYDDMKGMKISFMRKKSKRMSELSNKASILQYNQKCLQKKSKLYQKKLKILNKREEGNEKEEKRLEELEFRIAEEKSEMKRKKEEVKKIKREFETNFGLRRHLHQKDVHSERSFFLRRQLNELDRKVNMYRSEYKNVAMELQKEKEAVNDLRELQKDLKEKASNMSIELNTSENKIQIIQIQEERRRRGKERKKRKKKKKKKKGRKKRGKRNLLTREETIPEIDISLLEEASLKRMEFAKSEDIDDEGRKEIRKVANEVMNFKKGYKSLITQFDIVKKRMNFYDTNSLSSPESDQIRNTKKVGPKGRVTIVTTDVQSSTHLWERDIDAMISSMKIHNEIARNLIDKYDGFEIRTEGDAFLIAFDKVEISLRFALAFQSALLKVEWPEALLGDPATAEEKDEDGNIVFRGLRVRIGVHVGHPLIEKDVITGRDDYFGPMAIKTTLIEGQGRGGIIAISEDVYNSIQGCFGTDKDREVQEKKLGCTVFLKLLGYRKLVGLRRRDVIRWLVPYELRNRVKMVGEVKPHDFTRMRTMVNALTEKKKELDEKRADIRSQLNINVRLKALSTSNVEKDNIISYLKKKVRYMKNTYQRALVGRQNPFLEEETKIRNDLKKVLGKYMCMTNIYSDLKRNFGHVERVFESRLKGELKRFQSELDEVTTKLCITENRNRFNRKVWKIEKDMLEKRAAECEREMLTREEKIKGLRKKLKVAKEKKDEYFRNGKLDPGTIINIEEEENDNETTTTTTHMDKNFAHFLVSGETPIQKKERIRRNRKKKKRYHENEEEEEEEGEFREIEEYLDISGTNKLKIYRKGMIKIPKSEDHILPSLGRDEMIMGKSTQLYSIMNRSGQENMADEDILKLKKLKKSVSSTSSFATIRYEFDVMEKKNNDLFFQAPERKEQQQPEEKDNNNCKKKRPFTTKEGVSTENLGRMYFKMSKKQRLKWVGEKVGEIQLKYRKLEHSCTWSGSKEKLRSVKRMIRSVLRTTTENVVPTRPTSMKKRTKRFFTSPSPDNHFNTSKQKGQVTSRWGTSVRKIRSRKRRNWIFRNDDVVVSDSDNSIQKEENVEIGEVGAVEGMRMKKREEVYRGKKNRKKNKNEDAVSYRRGKVVDIPRKLQSSQVSYSRLLQNLPNIIDGIRERSEEGEVTNESKKILKRLYYDKNALNYQNILPRIN